MDEKVKEKVDLALSVISRAVKRDNKGFYLQENGK